MAPQDSHRNGQRCQSNNGVKQNVTEMGNLTGKRGCQILGRGDKFRDTAHLGMISGCRDNTFPLAIGHQGRGIGHIPPISQQRVMIKLPFCFLHRQGLAGKGGFIDPEIPHCKKPDVRRHLIAADQ